MENSEALGREYVLRVVELCDKNITNPPFVTKIFESLLSFGIGNEKEKLGERFQAIELDSLDGANWFILPSGCEINHFGTFAE